MRTTTRLAAAVLACAVAAALAAPASAAAPDAPVAVADAASTAASTPVLVDVLANDSDPDGDALMVSAVGAPGHGTAEVTGSGVTYSPAAGFVGEDTFTYTVEDPSGLTDAALVTVTVTAPPNAAPTTVPDNATAQAGQTVTIAVLANDSDPDGDALTLATVANAAHGSAAVAGQNVSYTAGSGFIGVDAFAYTVSDSRGETSTGTVTVTVTAPPVGPRKVPARMAAKVSGPLTRGDVPYSFRPGCPVGPHALRRITMNYYDYNGRLQRGQLIVSAAAVRPLLNVFAAGFRARFPVKKLNPADVYYAKGKRSPSGSDVAAMQDGNTSAFNCRPVTGNPYRTSQHSYGNAIDINTFENPYVTNSHVYPSTARSFLNRSRHRTGMILRNGIIAKAMRRSGWSWGARWAHPDYQHFSANGG